MSSFLSNLSLRMVGYLFLLLFSSSFASELENLEKNVDWPLICENHPQATKAVSSKFSEDHGGWCNLTFPFASKAEERTGICSDLYMDSLESTSGDAFTTTCNYKRFARCDPGFALVSGLCYKLHSEEDTFEGAEAKCDAIGGSITAGNDNEVDLKFLMYAANPVKYGIDAKAVWMSRKEQMVFRRSLEAPAVPGTIVKAYKKTASFYCVKNVLRSRTGYERMCNIIKNTFKLHAIFESGNCFMLSPSVSIDLGLKSSDIFSREKSFDHFNSECRWISDQDYSVSPVTHTRKVGMSALMENFKLDENVIIPGFKVSNSWYVMNKNIHMGVIESEALSEGAFIFAPHEPRNKGELESTGLVMGTKADKFKLKAIPAYVRGHRICMSGVSITDKPRTSCNDVNSTNPQLRDGWNGLLRDDGKVMCAKAIVADLDEKNPSTAKWYNCKNYEQMKQVCEENESVMTPIQSAEEQTLIAELVKKRMEEIDAFVSKHKITNYLRESGGVNVVWLGATKGEPMSLKLGDAIFIWDYDEKQIGYKNFASGEPNNAADDEYCLQMYITHAEHFRWNDMPCHRHCDPSTTVVGAVCARFIED